MDALTPAPPCTIVIFGAAGDLTKRLLIPAFYNLAGAKLLPGELRIVGLDHNDRTTDAWRGELDEALQSFAQDPSAEFHPDRIDDATWQWIAQRLDYMVFDFENAGDYGKLKDRLAGNVIFYFAVPERFFAPIAQQLGGAGLLQESEGAFRRLVIEKPFGADLPSARALNARIRAVAAENQIYRIDHFLGKEPVQGIMPLRFVNGLFEPMWTREYIAAVQITAAETLGVEGRGKFYEATGALRDMVPNHLFSLLTMTAMEPPASFAAEDVRNEKAKLLASIRPIPPEDAVRAQYGGYRDEENVSRDSRTETYAALRVHVDNRRWIGVPFYLRTGKRLARHLTTIAIRFRPAPQRISPDVPHVTQPSNLLTLGIAPDKGFSATFSAKDPGPALQTAHVCTGFEYKDFFDEPPDVGYETLLYHVMTGNALLFQREDMVDAGWKAVQPVLEAWASARDPLPVYAPGSDGPAEAAALPERDAQRWLPLT